MEAPDSLLGYLGLMATYQAQMVEEYSFHLEKEYDKTLERAEPAAERLEDSGADDSWSHFLLGAYYGMKGIHQVRQRSYLAGFMSGYSGISHLEKAAEANPPLYDAYLGLGVYDYWKGALTRRHWYLGFLPDRREEGVERIFEARDKGYYIGEAADLSLLFIYYDAAQHLEVEKTADRILARYPDCVIARVIRARSMAMRGQYRRAIAVMEELKESFPGLSIPDYYLGLFRCYSGLAPARAMANFRDYIAAPHVEAKKLSYAHLYLGELLARKGETQAAEADMQEAKRLYPDNPLIEEKLDWLTHLRRTGPVRQPRR